MDHALPPLSLGGKNRYKLPRIIPSSWIKVKCEKKTFWHLLMMHLFSSHSKYFSKDVSQAICDLVVSNTGILLFLSLVFIYCRCHLVAYTVNFVLQICCCSLFYGHNWASQFGNVNVARYMEKCELWGSRGLTFNSGAHVTHSFLLLSENCTNCWYLLWETSTHFKKISFFYL